MPHNYNDGCKITQENWEEHYPVPDNVLWYHRGREEAREEMLNIEYKIMGEFDSILNKVFLVNKKHQAFTTEQWNEEIAPLFREMLALLNPNN